MSEKSVFETLNDVNVSEYVEEKNNLKYLSWTYALAEVLKRYPDMTYEPNDFSSLNNFCICDDNLGYMVHTAVTINGIRRVKWLPVLDGAYKTMKNVPYTYMTKFGERTVEAATMFDINKALMRCLTKNFAMFGLGLYIYSGEDLPETEKKEIEEQKKKSDMLNKAINEIKELGNVFINAGGTKDELYGLIERHSGNKNIKSIKDISICEEIKKELTEMIKAKGNK